MRSSSFLLSVLNLRMWRRSLSYLPVCPVSSLGLRVLTRDFSTALEDVKQETPQLQNSCTSGGDEPRRMFHVKHSFGGWLALE